MVCIQKEGKGTWHTCAVGIHYLPLPSIAHPALGTALPPTYQELQSLQEPQVHMWHFFPFTIAGKHAVAQKQYIRVNTKSHLHCWNMSWVPLAYAIRNHLLSLLGWIRKYCRWSSHVFMLKGKCRKQSQRGRTGQRDQIVIEQSPLLQGKTPTI